MVALSLTSIYFYRKYTKVSISSAQISQKEVQSLVKEVSRLMVLPEGETPTVATVSDPDLLKDQEFFLKAKTGHKVLIFTNAKIAILYDPGIRKIINVAPLNIGEGTSRAE